jgi:hypothetical protein
VPVVGEKLMSEVVMEAIRKLVDLAPKEGGRGKVPFTYIVDPFCGDGELAISVFKKEYARHIIASDIRSDEIKCPTVEKARALAKKEGVPGRVSEFLFQGVDEMRQATGAKLFVANLPKEYDPKQLSVFLSKARNFAAPGDAMVIADSGGNVAVLLLTSNRVQWRNPFVTRTQVA